ncbi:metallo-beta-lactamase domain-containing protein 1 isoform X2 [Periplaneta americana]|uniref:metallo-beta-lactamase domain-containing protein 1 isoform X2 n=1 Tax=Periplaneta americana TaxID=6978 RepID=UPI0037E733A3
MAYEVFVLYDGYSKTQEFGMKANCTCTLLKGKKNVIVDTMTPWDKDKIVEALSHRGLACSDIDYVVCSHGHSDHVGNNNLFLKAKHIVGFEVSFTDHYFIHPFETGDLFEREEDIADPSIWKYIAGSSDPEKQEQNRNKILQIADWIVPGHGPMFQVTAQMKSSLSLSN